MAAADAAVAAPAAVAPETAAGTAAEAPAAADLAAPEADEALNQVVQYWFCQECPLTGLCTPQSWINKCKKCGTYDGEEACRNKIAEHLMKSGHHNLKKENAMEKASSAEVFLWTGTWSTLKNSWDGDTAEPLGARPVRGRARPEWVRVASRADEDRLGIAGAWQLAQAKAAAPESSTPLERVKSETSLGSSRRRSRSRRRRRASPADATEAAGADAPVDDSGLTARERELVSASAEHVFAVLQTANAKAKASPPGPSGPLAITTGPSLGAGGSLLLRSDADTVMVRRSALLGIVEAARNTLRTAQYAERLANSAASSFRDQAAHAQQHLDTLQRAYDEAELYGLGGV